MQVYFDNVVEAACCYVRTAAVSSQCATMMKLRLQRVNNLVATLHVRVGAQREPLCAAELLRMPLHLLQWLLAPLLQL